MEVGRRYLWRGRWVQSGFIFHYALVMILGVFATDDLVRLGRFMQLINKENKQNEFVASLAIWHLSFLVPFCSPLGRDDHARGVRWIALIGALAGCW